jgi:hypothetical protein
VVWKRSNASPIVQNFLDCFNNNAKPSQ